MQTLRFIVAYTARCILFYVVQVIRNKIIEFGSFDRVTMSESSSDESSSDGNINEEECDTVIPTKRLKGVFHTEAYKRNVVRKSKVAGKQHRNWKGNIVEARKTGKACR